MRSDESIEPSPSARDTLKWPPGSKTTTPISGLAKAYFQAVTTAQPPHPSHSPEATSTKSYAQDSWHLRSNRSSLNTTSPKRLPLLILLFVVLLALWLRLPRIGEGLPFFHREDEAHHFNRLAEMMKEGRLDPQYFHKPSLHFYLRMPVFGATFLYSVKQGHIRSVQEVITRDPFGIARYSFSASHPGLVKGSRAFTVLLGLGLVLMTASLAWTLSGSAGAALLSASVVALSPALISEGAVIGVDILMAFMCVLCVLIALRTHERFTWTGLLLCSLTAGLAVSSKYNAAPILIVPVLLGYLHGSAPFRSALFAALAGAVGFLIGTPYLLSNIPLFLDHVAYEIWHYGVAGHVGNMGEPGFAQLWFYLSWLSGEAVGPLMTTFGVLGIAAFVSRNRTKNFLFLVFPLLFVLLMVLQKTNFVRNMLVIIPFISIIASVSFFQALKWLEPSRKVRAVLIGAFLLLGLGYPLKLSLLERDRVLSFTDSRSNLIERLVTSPESLKVTAVAGQLQLPRSGITGRLFKFDQENASLLSLYQRGYDHFIVSGAYPVSPTDNFLFSEVSRIDGTSARQRIVVNPEIRVLKPNNSSAVRDALHEYTRVDSSELISVKLSDESPKNCSSTHSNVHESAEMYCWTNGRAMRLAFPDLSSALRTSPDSEYVTLALEAMSPWPGNELRFVSGNWRHAIEFPEGGAWQNLTLRIPLAAMRDADSLFVETDRVHSPKLSGLGSDDRFLGVALRNIRLR